MTTLSRLILALVLCSFLLLGCQTGAIPTPTITKNTPVFATRTPIPATTTPLPATETPVPEQSSSSSVHNAGNAARLKRITELELPESMLNTLVFSPDNRALIWKASRLSKNCKGTPGRLIKSLFRQTVRCWPRPAMT